jgi:hypothetical protein
MPEFGPPDYGIRGQHFPVCPTIVSSSAGSLCAVSVILSQFSPKPLNGKFQKHKILNFKLSVAE